MDNFQIRKVTPQDIAPLQEISRQTFFETFAASNSSENMKQYLEEELSTEKLLEEVQNANSEFYFALLDNRVVGYLKLNQGNSQTERQHAKALEIERIYVLQELHGQQIGQLLYEKALEVARKKAVDFVWLGVWEENPRAIRFYQKNGFEAFDTHIFKLGDEEQTDIMMKLPLINK